MTRTDTAGRTLRQRWRTGRWAVLILVVLVAVLAAGVLLTAPRSGGPMDPESTAPSGAHALTTLLAEHGVDVVAADTLDEVADSARPDTLLVLAQTFFLDEEQLHRLDRLPGDRLLIAPAAQPREVLAPALRSGGPAAFGGEPRCAMPEANRAGDVQFGMSETYVLDDADSGVDLTSCYDGAVVRYPDGDRVITVVGNGAFLSNGGLTARGNAALAMNLTGTQPRVIWFAPQRAEPGSGGDATLSDLIPDRVGPIVWQLVLVVALVAIWRGRRLGPLVAERLPVVVRASETVEGRGRLYRSHRARDRAAEALRTAALQRLVPRVGLEPGAGPPAVAQSVADRCGRDPAAVAHVLYGPAPASDADLVTLAHELDNIERQVAQS